MSSLELSAILLPAFFAGLVAIFATVVIERGGGALGGIITLPTTIVPASIGIWGGVSGIEPFTNAMSMVPIGMLLNVVFLGLWRILPSILRTKMNGRNLVFSVSMVSIFTWAFFAGISTYTVEVISDDIGPGIIGLIATSAAIVIGVSAVQTNPPAPPGMNRVGPSPSFLGVSPLGLPLLLQCGSLVLASHSYLEWCRSSLLSSSLQWYPCGYLREQTFPSEQRDQ